MSDNIKILQQEWDNLGKTFANDINKMVEFGETHGWENWKGKEPSDNRDHLASEVLSLLREANSTGKTEEFRKMFSPAHAPFISILEKQGQSIENLCVISDDSIAFVVGSSYEKRQAYVLTGKTVEPLSNQIESIGKSHQNRIFAVAEAKKVTTYKEWKGEIIAEFQLPDDSALPISQMIPFNDGLSVLLISSEGIYLLGAAGSSMIHPVPDPEDEEWTSDIDMEHAALSFDNKLIAVGDQDSEHRILNSDGVGIAEIGPQSSYPHYALFSKDGEQVILNSCHFYNGTTIGVPTADIHGLKIEPYTEDDRYTVIDEDCRVYAAVATADYYILGDAGGYVKAFSKDGRKLWRYFLGSTISGMSISEDEKTLWVASYAGIIHKLKLDAGKRDEHTIGTGDHHEEFRIIFWKEEQKPLIW
jgi:WD40 repeat protein